MTSAGVPVFAILLAMAATALVTQGLTRLLIRQAARVGLEDVPNHRSSHHRITPSGGGLAFVVATAVAVVAVLASGTVASPGLAWLAALAGCLGLAVIGLLDDLFSLSQRLRLACQFAAVALVMLAGLGDAGLPASPAGWLLTAGLAFAAVWWINLFNFMDGIDGLATSEALFLLVAGLVLALMPTVGASGTGQADLDLIDWLALLLVAALLGFLPLNWSPAKIFMGDAGSLFLGVAIFLVATHGVTSGRIGAWFWPIAAGSFVCDASVTLVRRLVSGQNVVAAHRSHLYQRLSRRWRDHARVTLVYSLINISWFLPLALLSHYFPHFGGALLVTAYAPALLIGWLAGAGKPDIDPAAEAGPDTGGQDGRGPVPDPAGISDKGRARTERT